MKKLAAQGLVWALLLSATSAFAIPASGPDTRSYLFGGPSLVIEDSSRFSDRALGSRVGIGKRFNAFWGLEVDGFFNEFDSGADGADWREYGGKLSGLYYYNDSRRWAPYFAVGGGIVRNEDRRRSRSGAQSRSITSDSFGDVGVGLFGYLPVGRYDVGIRGDYRYRLLDIDDIPGVNLFEEHVFSLDLVLPLGGLRPKMAVLAMPKDSDGDGVPDEQDRCADTPAGVSVDVNGCPLDEDGDGVPDFQDRCPGTPVGTMVDHQGCPLAPVAEPSFEPVYFSYDRSELTDYARATLDTAARMLIGRLRDEPALRMELSGHTDWMGTEAYNLALSETRARSVKRYLVSRGVDPARLVVAALGESSPAASNETDEGRAKNRRVELRVRVD